MRKYRDIPKIISPKVIELVVTNYLGYDKINGINDKAGSYSPGMRRITDPLQKKLEAMDLIVSFYENTIPSTHLPKSDTDWAK